MNCLKCGQKMYRGHIPGDRYGLKWVNNEKGEPQKIRVSGPWPNLMINDALYCPTCQIVVISLPEPPP